MRHQPTSWGREWTWEGQICAGLCVHSHLGYLCPPGSQVSPYVEVGKLQECRWDRGVRPCPQNNMPPAQPRGQPSLGFPRAPSVSPPQEMHWSCSLCAKNRDVKLRRDMLSAGLPECGGPDSVLSAVLIGVWRGHGGVRVYEKTPPSLSPLEWGPTQQQTPPPPSPCWQARGNSPAPLLLLDCHSLLLHPIWLPEAQG